MNETQTRTRWGAAIVLFAPLVVAAGLVAHPFIPLPTDEGAVSDAAIAAPTRWAIAHLTFAVGTVLLALAFVELGGYLRRAGEDRWSDWALPFAVAGSGLFAILPALEFAPYAAVETGAGVQAAQEAVIPFFIPVLVTGGVLFAVGAIGFSRAIARSGVLGRGMTTLVSAALIALAAARVIPLGVVQLYVHGALVILALWPLGVRMWGAPEPRLAEHATTA